MRAQFRTIVTAVAALAALAACAHGTVRPAAAEGGEVALAPAAAPVASEAAARGATFAPITLTELAGRVDATPTARRALLSRTTSDAPVFGVPTSAPRAADGGVELWRGTYVGRTYGQRGAIALALRPAAGSVRGTVAWRVRSASPALSGVGADSVALVRAPVLTASRDSGQLVLHLDSYFDPACNCTARATFRGAVRGDTLVGRFSVEGPATVVSEERGRWRAVRVMP